MDYLMKNAMILATLWNHLVEKGTDLDIADDLVLFTNKSKLIQLMKDWLKNISKKVDLKIIANMTKKLQKIGHPDDDAMFLERPHWK